MEPTNWMKLRFGVTKLQLKLSMESPTFSRAFIYSEKNVSTTTSNHLVRKMDKRRFSRIAPNIRVILTVDNHFSTFAVPFDKLEI